MYNVSDSYKTTMEGQVIKSRVAGTITFLNGTKVTIDDSNIINGSLSINNKAVNNSDFGLGACYVGEMDVTIYNTQIDRYALYGAEVDLSFFLTLDDGTEEELPLGVFYVDTPKRSKKLIQLKCYDAMTKFDINVTEDTWGQPFALLTLACEKVGVVLQNTEEEILAMCNGQENFSLNQEKVGTYRDLISYLSMLLGGYATINRHGKLEIRQFHQTPDLTITATKRTDSTINDYETFFNSVTARFIAEQNYYPYTETIPDMDTGIQLDLGDIPIVQGLEEFKHTLLLNVLEVLKGIRYVPSEFSMVSDPSIDLGDGLTLTDVNNTHDDVFVIVTAYAWTYHKEEKITSDGSDALLANVSDQTRKQIDSMEATIASKNLVVKQYTNADEYKIGKDEINIIRLSWSAYEETTAIFFATVPIELTKDGNLVLTYYKSLEKVGELTKYLARGKHFVTFVTYVPSKASENITWLVSAKLEYFESDSRKQDAKILSFKDWIDNQNIITTEDSSGNLTSVFGYEYKDQEVDTSIPSGKILAEEIKAVAFAQGLNATAGWDGTLELSDDLTTINFNKFKVLTTGMKEVVTSAMIAPDKHGISDALSVISFNGFKVLAVEDHVVVDEVITQQTVTFGLNDYIEVVDGITKLKTEYQYDSIKQTIDEGQMISVKAVTTDKASVESVVVE